MVDQFPFEYQIKSNSTSFEQLIHGKRILLSLLSFLSISQSYYSSAQQIFHNPFSENSTIISEIEPPLRENESVNDRRLLDTLFDRYWNEATYREEKVDVVADGGREYTYGEITPLGTRQLIHYLNLSHIYHSNGLDGLSDGYHQIHRLEDDASKIIFYDLGSGTG